jgi:YebC/PmpR family DNA-binding regulatory protein
MSGHNKWSTIKHKKAAVDAKRGKVFTKIIKELSVAARIGGSDPDSNPRLRSAILAAKSANMPKDTMTRAIKKGAGELGGNDYAEITYEGYGPGGVAVFVEVLTDNRNRTVGEVRYAFAKYNGNLGQDGSVGWMFERKGQILVGGEGEGIPVTEDQLFEVAVDAGADNISQEDDLFFVTCDPTSLYTVRDAIDETGFNIQEANLVRIAQNTVDVDSKSAGTLIKLLDVLEDNDDVQNVFHNAEFSDDVLEALG